MTKRKIDIEELEKKLEVARHELALQIGSDMVEKEGLKSYSAYKSFMQNARNASPPFPSNLQEQSFTFQQRLERWTEDNHANRIEYRDFYHELLTFFRELNRKE